MKVYVASSWRNELYPQVVKAISEAGHEVYDFRNPEPGDHGFSWSEIDPDWKDWTPEDYRAALRTPRAQDGFCKDAAALEDAEAVVLVTPCGPSAHLELGFGLGEGKLGIVLVHWEPQMCYEGAGFSLTRRGEPELMYKLADFLCLTIEEVVDVLAGGWAP
jgi:hypothetical protein